MVAVSFTSIYDEMQSMHSMLMLMMIIIIMILKFDAPFFPQYFISRLATTEYCIKLPKLESKQKKLIFSIYSTKLQQVTVFPE